jgi:hypothetical protein
MHDAWYFSISRLPADAKQQLADHLANCDMPEQYRSEIAHIIDFMNHGESSDGVETLEQIQMLDQRRQQDLKKIAPDLSRILGYV